MSSHILALGDSADVGTALRALAPHISAEELEQIHQEAASLAGQQGLDVAKSYVEVRLAGFLESLPASANEEGISYL